MILTESDLDSIVTWSCNDDVVLQSGVPLPIEKRKEIRQLLVHSQSLLHHRFSS